MLSFSFSPKKIKISLELVIKNKTERAPSQNLLSGSRKGSLKIMAHPLSRYTRNLLRTALRKSRPEHFDLFLDWPKIIGPEFSSFCTLQKVTFPPHQRREGRLYVKVPSSLSSNVSFSKTILIERVNMYFGYPAIADLSVVQIPPKLTDLPKRPQRKDPPPNNSLKVCEKIEKIQDPQLKEAFESLIRTFLAKD